MRRLLLLLSLLMTVSCAKTDPMVGQWKGLDSNGKEVVLFLNKTGEFQAVANGERVTGTWRVDETVVPNLIELNFEGKKVSSIVKLQDDNLVIELVGPDGKLPTSFSSKATYYQRLKS